jgi:exopolyphosphatase/guanosine-5'-triphosphate,3'-diphosphate pyrophosphatase
MRVAAIDIGTNSVHLVVADVGPDGSITLIEKAREQVELGRGGLEQHKITAEATERAITALVNFRKAMDILGVEAASACATSAVREAQNGTEFCDRVTEETGLQVYILSGWDEARLVWMGARTEVDFSRGPALFVDIGGGSVELVVGNATHVISAHSLPLGHLRMTEQFVRGDPPGGDTIQAIRRYARGLLQAITPTVRLGELGMVVGTSGSIRTLGRMATLARGQIVPPHDHGLVLQRGELKKLLLTMQDLKANKLSELPGMDSRRKATLPAAAAVLYQIMKSLELETLSTSESALREGILADWIERHRPELQLSGRPGTTPQLRGVLHLMDRYQVDRAHAEHVRALSLSLYDGLLAVHGLGPDSRAMLEYAALLHDVGHHIDSRDHNRHGEYLVLNSRLAGFTAPETAVLASVVRYHRGSRPKSTHKTYQTLSRSNQRRVDVLSAILRLADSLDRSHHQPVSEVSVQMRAREIIVVAGARREAYLERWAAERRADVLAHVLNRPVRIELAPDPTLAPLTPLS